MMIKREVKPEERIVEIYLTLYQKVQLDDPEEWRPDGRWPLLDPASDERWQAAIGAVLVQAQSWNNAKMAVKRLISAGRMSPAKIAACPDEELRALIRPAGYPTRKVPLLKKLAFLVLDCGGMDAFIGRDAEIIRRELKNLKGVGDETADTILLYACEKPVFIVDRMTKRMAICQGVIQGTEKDHKIQAVFHAAFRDFPVAERVKTFQAFHARITELGPRYCRTCPGKTACGEMPGTCPLHGMVRR